MRRVLVLYGLTWAAAALGHGKNVSNPDTSLDIPASLQHKKISVEERSNVCVYVRIDPVVLGDFDVSKANVDFGGILTSELRRLYEERGGSSFVVDPKPDHSPSREIRFVPARAQTDFLCRDSEDIRIVVSYIPRADGTPFIANYLIEQRSSVQTGSAMRNVFEDIRTGRIHSLNIDEPIQTAIVFDLKILAVGIVRIIDPRNDNSGEVK